MRWIVASSLRYRYLVVFLAVVLMIFGIARMKNSAIDVFPEFAPPKVEVQTVSIGLSASAVEELITVPLEQALNGVPGLDVLRSRSVTDLSDIVMIFKPGTDVILARQLVQERLAAVYSTLPSWATPPIIIQPLSSTSRAMKIGIYSDEFSQRELSLITYWKIRARLLEVPGVANVPIWGEQRQIATVQVDQEKLETYDRQLGEVMTVMAGAVEAGLLKEAEGAIIGRGGFMDTPKQRIGI